MLVISTLSRERANDHPCNPQLQGCSRPWHNRNPYIIHLNIALSMVVSPYFGGKKHASNGQHVSFNIKEPCTTGCQTSTAHFAGGSTRRADTRHGRNYLLTAGSLLSLVPYRFPAFPSFSRGIVFSRVRRSFAILCIFTISMKHRILNSMEVILTVHTAKPACNLLVEFESNA